MQISLKHLRSDLENKNKQLEAEVSEVVRLKAELAQAREKIMALVGGERSPSPEEDMDERVLPHTSTHNMNASPGARKLIEETRETEGAPLNQALLTSFDSSNKPRTGPFVLSPRHPIRTEES